MNNNPNFYVYTELCRFSDTVDNNYLNNGETLVFNVYWKDGEYIFFNKDLNTTALYVATTGVYFLGAIRLDNPIQELDTDAWLMFGAGNVANQRFTRQYGSESLGAVPQLFSDGLLSESTSFDKNVYNGKVPLCRVWAGSPDLGLRGWTSHLVIVPQSYIVSSQDYDIDGATYFGLGLFDNQIIFPGNSVTPVGQRVLLKKV